MFRDFLLFLLGFFVACLIFSCYKIATVPASLPYCKAIMTESAIASGLASNQSSEYLDLVFSCQGVKRVYGGAK
jgi:hypothetical protein